MAGWVFRQNNVPHYQRLFQKHDGLRQWQKVRQLPPAPWDPRSKTSTISTSGCSGPRTPRSKFFLYPYYVMLWGSFGAAMYMSCRVVLVGAIRRPQGHTLTGYTGQEDLVGLSAWLLSVVKWREGDSRLNFGFCTV
ncbi:hypothetical protein IWZ01DRAFT_485834 [Phyllosticta capitalensis]